MSDPLNPQALKAILASPEDWLKTQPEQVQREVAVSKFALHLDVYREQKRLLKQKKQQKSELARQFKGSDAAQRELLKQQMQTQSSELKAIEQSLSNAQTAIVDLLARALAVVDGGTVKNPYMRKSYPAESSAATDIEYRCVADADLQNWKDYVDAHPSGNFYQKLDLCRDIAAVLGQRCYGYVAVRADGTLCGVLPLLRLSSRLFGDFAVSVPYFNYGGALADSPDIETALMTMANAELLELGCAHIEYRETVTREAYPARCDKASMVLQLADDCDAQFAAFPAKLRAQIRRPQQENTRAAQGGIELLDDFYRVFATNMRDLGTPVYGRELFAMLLSRYSDYCSLQIIFLDDKAVAAGFLIRYKNVVEIPWASTLRRVNKLSINMLLYWEVLQFAIRGGADWFDFGRSSKDAGTYKFKQQWGAEPVEHYWQVALPEGEELPALNPDNPKFALMIAVWKRLPVWLTKLVGPAVVRNIP